MKNEIKENGKLLAYWDEELEWYITLQDNDILENELINLEDEQICESKLAQSPDKCQRIL